MAFKREKEFEYSAILALVSPGFQIPSDLLSCSYTNQHVHKNDWHPQYKHHEQDVGHCRIFQLAPRHKQVRIVELTKSHHKDCHHRVGKRGIMLLLINKMYITSWNVRG